MSTVWALVMLELRTVFRTPSTWIGYLALSVLFGLSPLFGQAVMGQLDEQPAVEAAPQLDHTVECPETRPPLAARGEWPDWFGWEPTPEHGAALSIERRDSTWTLTLHGGESDERDLLRACIDDAVDDARVTRLEALGLHWPRTVVNLDFDLPDTDEDDATAPLQSLNLFAFAIATIALALSGGLCIEQVPRRRSTGMLETLRGVPGSMVGPILGFVGSSTLLSTGWVLVGAAVWALTARHEMFEPDFAVLLHQPFLIGTIAAISVRASLFAPTAQAATVRWLGALFVLGITGAAAGGLLWAGYPALAALVPIGGVALGAGGVLGGWALLADVTSLVWTGALVVWCGRLLDEEETSAAGSDPALLRQARGNWWPEATALGLMGSAAALVSSASVIGQLFWISVAVGFLVFMVTPAVLASRVLAVPQNELVPLDRPAPRDLALSTLLSVGVMGLALLITGATAAVLPENSVVAGFNEQMSELMSDWRTALWIGLFPAIAEEILFRGAVMGLLLKSGRPWLANVGQATFFAFAHALGVRLPWTFVFGLIAGWLRIRTGSLWAGMVIHLLNNTVFALLVAFAPEVLALPWWAYTLTLPLFGLLVFFSRAPEELEPAG